MSSLTTADKLYLEKVLGMRGGYALDFNYERLSNSPVWMALAWL